MPSGRLDNPARKMHIEDIASVRNEDGNWVYCDSEIQFKINLVWLQGTIANLCIDMDEICLREGEKTVTVNNCKNIPGGNNWMQLGQYIMVFGELRATQRTTPNVRAIKVSNLSHNPLFKQMWSYDVKEAKLIYSELEGKGTNPHTETHFVQI